MIKRLALLLALLPLNSVAGDMCARDCGDCCKACFECCVMSFRGCQWLCCREEWQREQDKEQHEERQKLQRARARRPVLQTTQNFGGIKLSNILDSSRNTVELDSLASGQDSVYVDDQCVWGQPVNIQDVRKSAEARHESGNGIDATLYKLQAARILQLKFFNDDVTVLADGNQIYRKR